MNGLDSSVRVAQAALAPCVDCDAVEGEPCTCDPAGALEVPSYNGKPIHVHACRAMDMGAWPEYAANGAGANYRAPIAHELHVSPGVYSEIGRWASEVAKLKPSENKAGAELYGRVVAGNYGRMRSALLCTFHDALDAMSQLYIPPAPASASLKMRGTLTLTVADEPRSINVVLDIAGTTVLKGAFRLHGTGAMAFHEEEVHLASVKPYEESEPIPNQLDLPVENKPVFDNYWRAVLAIGLGF